MSPPTGTDLHTSSSASTDSHLPASSIAKDREGYDPWSRMRGSGQEERPWHMPPELGLRLLCTAGIDSSGWLGAVSSAAAKHTLEPQVLEASN